MRKNKRKFLDDIGCIYRPTDLLGDRIERKRWKKQRKEYGFDEREVYTLNYMWHLWLYEHLNMYLQVADGIPVKNEFKYRNKIYTQEEIIQMILDRLTLELGPDTSWNTSKENIEYVNEIEKLWAVVCSSLWC